jgi:hypothetical protein
MPRLLKLFCRLTSERIRRTVLQSVRIRRVGSALRPLLAYLGYTVQGLAIPQPINSKKKKMKV